MYNIRSKVSFVEGWIKACKINDALEIWFYRMRLKNIIGVVGKQQGNLKENVKRITYNQNSERRVEIPWTHNDERHLRKLKLYETYWGQER